MRQLIACIVRTTPESGIPCDLLLLRGTCIVNEAMLSGESTPLLKESVELREGTDRLDMNGTDRNNVLFSGTKALQVEKAGEGGILSKSFWSSKVDSDFRSARWWLSCCCPPNRFRDHSGPARPHDDLLY